MIMRRPYPRTATRRAQQHKNREEPRRQPNWLNDKLRTAKFGNARPVNL
jgi:hypothetical protein